MGPNVIWQSTQKCDLDCRSCVLASEGSRRSADELTTFEAYKAIDQIAALDPKSFTISGGDPLARRDLFQLVDYACRRGLDPAIAVSPTRNLTPRALETLQHIGLRRIEVSLHGSTAERHDAVHATAGAFASTIDVISRARGAGMAVSVDTLVTRRTIDDLVPIGDTIEPLGIDAWNLYFLVPLDGSRGPEPMTAGQAEEAFAGLARTAATGRFVVRTVEAPHYRRFLLQRRTPKADGPEWSDFSGYIAGDDPLAAVADETVFITSRGEVRPSVFLPISGGNLRYRSLAAIVRSGDIFSAFRKRLNLKGKCGLCEFREMCGGSRARAWAITGDLFASDPLCAYQPPAMEVSA